MKDEAVITIEGLTFGYNGAPVLEDVNLTINQKEFVWVVGPNGGGKTTLLKLMLGLLRPARGMVRVFGQSPRQARPRIGYMPQYVQLDPQFPVDVLDIVLMGRLGNGVRWGPHRKHDKEAAAQALREVGLWEKHGHSFSTLSGGQQRRLLIARALACEPDLLLLDEPTANLDLVFERELFELLRKLNQRLTIVMVSHDPAFVSQFVERVVCVNRKVAVHPTSEMEEEIMNELYGRRVRMVRHDQYNANGRCV
jgi:zinc transport system ATP-binding protein